MYRSVGVTKQAVHKSQKRQQAFDRELTDLVIQADKLRSDHPGCGVEKMYTTLKPKLMGRDKFCEIFMDLGYRIKKIPNYKRTTIPSHIRYPNLIEGMQVTKPFQVVQSDITYIYINDRYYYIAFVIDVYTRTIIGYNTSDNMRKESNIKAMKMALKNAGKHSIEIHHSDRGAQYGSDDYRRLLRDNNIEISMGSIAQENAFAERVNGTIKNEYLLKWNIQNLSQLKTKLIRAVNHYNEKRKHLAFKNEFSPKEFRENSVNLNTQKRPKVIIYADGKSKIKEALSLPDFKPKKEPQAHNCPIVI